MRRIGARLDASLEAVSPVYREIMPLQIRVVVMVIEKNRSM
jgi:hypothetical protein